MTARKALLGGAAALGIAAEIAAGALWVRSHGSFQGAVRHAWAAATSDLMVVLFLVDMAILSAAGLLWMAVDARRRGAGVGQAAAWFVAGIFLGSPILLLYLARRER